MRPIIHTQRLILRPTALDDAARVARLAGDLRVSRMTTRIPHPYPPEAAEGWLWLQSLSAGRTQLEHTFAVVLAEHGLIGMVGASRRDTRSVFEIGYWLGEPYWGSGYATEAGRAFVRWLYEDQDVRALAAGYFEDNPGSRRVLEKLGFTPTEQACPRYSLARDTQVLCHGMAWTPPAPDKVRAPEAA